MPRATRNRTLIAQARVSEAELAEWRAKAAAAGVPLSETVAAGDGKDSHLDCGSRRSRAGAHPRARADRSAGGGFEAASRALEEGLQGDRRSVARGVNAIWKQQQARERHLGPERDFGPSR